MVTLNANETQPGMQAEDEGFFWPDPYRSREPFGRVAEKPAQSSRTEKQYAEIELLASIAALYDAEQL